MPTEPVWCKTRTQTAEVDCANHDGGSVFVVATSVEIDFQTYLCSSDCCPCYVFVPAHVDFLGGNFPQVLLDGGASSRVGQAGVAGVNGVGDRTPVVAFLWID